MDKRTTYQNLIKETVQHYADIFRRANESEVQSVVVFDDKNGHFQWLSVGWENGKKRALNTHLYVRYFNHKIWIEKDTTENGIAQDFLAAGIPHSDIVLAFRAPEMRELTEFAIA